jgi:pSer/pThr/pTyr-binding forkhead associated (FHA) protein
MPANKCSNPGCEFFNRPLPNNMDCCPGCGRPLGNVIASTPPITNPSVIPVMRLIHTTTGREFRFSGEEGYIGRRSQIHGTIPEIDLVGIPHESVVSRSHARIFWDWNQKTYMILDTSRNGSYLNGNQLSQGVNYRLNNGDSLQLGQDGLVQFKIVVS